MVLNGTFHCIPNRRFHCTKDLYISEVTHISFDNSSEESSHVEQVKVRKTGSNATIKEDQPRPRGVLLNQDIARVKISVDKVVNEQLHKYNVLHTVCKQCMYM